MKERFAFGLSIVCLVLATLWLLIGSRAFGQCGPGGCPGGSCGQRQPWQTQPPRYQPQPRAQPQQRPAWQPQPTMQAPQTVQAQPPAFLATPPDPIPIPVPIPTPPPARPLVAVPPPASSYPSSDPVAKQQEPAVPEVYVWTAAWCPHCPTYKAESIDPLIAQGYRVAFWDAEKFATAAARWKVTILPTTILLYLEGPGGAKEIGRFVGKAPPDVVELVFRLAGVRRVAR